MIEVKNLTKIYYSGGKETIALDNVSFKVDTGDFVTVTGRSGSGKSTLLYQMSLLDEPTSGSVFIDKVDLAKLKGNEIINYRLYNFGYVFQDYALIPTLTATENVLISLVMQDYPYLKAKNIAHDVLKKVGLFDRRNNLPSQLSGGEQQRVSISRAIANKPKIIFADEPTANLDTETAENILNILIELNSQGQTIIMVTHEPDYAKLGSKSISLSDGKLIN